MVFVCSLALQGCGKNSPASVSPSASAGAGDADAAADGSTLKVTAPAPLSPSNDVILEDTAATLVIGAASGIFTASPVAYDFELYDPNENKIRTEVVNGLNWRVTGLEQGTRYHWRARATSDNEFGPWSAFAVFRITEVNDGYLRGNELYDPLINGKSVGVLHGPLTFIPGVGIRFHAQASYIHYELPQTLTEGEYSVILTGMDANTDGDKTKLISMSSGYGDIVTNDRRMTVEKRGDPAGIVAWRFISYDDQVDTEGAEREYVGFQASRVYFLQATWRNNRFGVIIRDGGVDGNVIYNKSKAFKGRAYDPMPHVVYLGSPVGRSGESAASVDNVTFRQVWVSGRARPGFANK
jgi:hypothetical protein